MPWQKVVFSSPSPPFSQPNLFLFQPPAAAALGGERGVENFFWLWKRTIFRQSRHGSASRLEGGDGEGGRLLSPVEGEARKVFVVSISQFRPAPLNCQAKKSSLSHPTYLHAFGRMEKIKSIAIRRKGEEESYFLILREKGGAG